MIRQTDRQTDRQNAMVLIQMSRVQCGGSAGDSLIMYERTLLVVYMTQVV